MGWGLLVNNLVATATDTEDTHALLQDILPRNKYFRFNPMLIENWGIDEKNKDVLHLLKELSRDEFRNRTTGPDKPLYDQMFKALRY